MMFKEKFRERINKLYRQEGTSSAAMARKAGLAPAGFNYYRNGKRCPDAQALYKICTTFNCSADWLLGLSDVQMPDADYEEQEQEEKAAERIRIYFVDNHVLDTERDKVTFTKWDGTCFPLGEELTEPELTYGDFVRDGRVLVNWENVCFVKESNRETEEE